MRPKQPKPSLKSRALQFLARREYSRLELARKLAPLAEPEEDVEAVLNFLEQHRFLSGERFSEALIRTRQSQYGNRRIMAELRTHQLDPAILAASKAELDASEVDRARVALARKFSRLNSGTSDMNSGDTALESAEFDAFDAPHSGLKSGKRPPSAAQLRQAEAAKKVRYLAQRGFSPDAIRSALKAEELDSPDLDTLAD